MFEQRGPENRLGLAVSLCALRFLGFVPDDIASIPDEALVFVAGQVDAGAHEWECRRNRVGMIEEERHGYQDTEFTRAI